MYFHLIWVFMLLSVFAQGRCLNNRPIIGIVAQRTYGHEEQYGDEYINAFYVKYLEMAGARVMAIKGHQPQQYYEDIFLQINGVLLPGGGANITHSPYAKASLFFYQKSIEAMKKGDYFPIWGTCLGFEMLTVLASGKDLLTPTDSENLTLPLKLVPGYRTSRLLSAAPPEIISYLSQEPVTVNSHQFSLLAEVKNRILDREEP